MTAISLQIAPTCCPDAYTCGDEYECPRHGGFTVCCDRAEAHVPQDRAAWHQQMDRWEQDLLNRHIQRYRVLQAFDMPDAYVGNRLSSLI
ncbi:hypothetical protein [Streptomyces sp. NPDC018055]|uniref:hypothetical protein n=1 Tax=Streptomyces sp. NPDC018055 TaxID=3365038 RepID=UPI0037A29B0F